MDHYIPFVRCMLVCGTIYMVGCGNSPANVTQLNNQGQDGQKTDSAAYMVAPAVPEQTEAIEPAMIVDRPTLDHPVTATMALSALPAGDVSRGELWIKLFIAPGHYVYADVREHEPFQPLAVDVRLQPGAQFEGEWIYPRSQQLNGHAVYYDSVVVHRRLRLTSEPNEPIKAVVQYQVCNEDVCFPPAKIQLADDWSP